MAEQHTFPQTGDNDDAENFGQLIGQDLLSDFVATGFEFTTVDYTVPEVTITTGLCFIEKASETASTTGETRLRVNHAVQLPQNTLALTDNATNYVFVEPDFSTNDNGTFVVYTDTSNASADALRIGTVDTSNNTATEENRDPSGAFESVTVSELLDLADDVDLQLGDDGDFVVYYDSSNDRLSIDDINGTNILNVYPSGPVEAALTLDLNDNDLTDNTDTIWDSTSKHIPLTALENSSLTVTAGDGLKGGGSVTLGSSTTVDIEPADFAGSFLSDDGTDNLQVDIGRGLENDGSGNIQFDEDTSYTFTSGQTFGGDIIDASSNLIYDQSNNWVPQARLESDSLTITAGNALTGGGVVSLGGSTTVNVDASALGGSFLSDDGTGSLQVDIGRGLENDGSGNIRFDEDTSYTFTSSQTFEQNIDTAKITNQDYKEDHVFSETWGDLSTSSFSQSINTQDAGPTGIAWNNDGTKLYEVGDSADNIYEYTVSTAFDVSTASFSQSINSVGGSPQGIAWNSDGTKLYEIGGGNIHESTLSTAFDISTATFNQSISTQDVNATSLAWNNDGTKLYELGNGNDTIYEYNVSTAYDISTATVNQSIGTQDITPTGIEWSAGGTKLYEVGNGSDNIYEYEVSTRFDISTATFSRSINTQDTVANGIAWNNGGTKLYEVGSNSDNIYESTLTSVYDSNLSEANVQKVTIRADSTFSFSNVDTSLGNSATLRIVQDSIGGHTPTFNNIRWPQGNSPSWDTAANALNLVTLVYDPDDDVWDGFFGGGGFN